MTTPYANFPITDSSGRKYADRGITLPQLLPGAFKEVYRRRAVPACIVLPHSLLCSFFHISVFHSNLRQAGDLQTEGYRSQSVTHTFYLPHCMTVLYTNIPITDSSGRKCGDIAMQQVKRGKCKWLRKCNVNDWLYANYADTAHGKCDGESCSDVGHVANDKNGRQYNDTTIGEKRQRQAAKGTSGESISGLITEKATTSGGKVQKESGVLLRTIII